MPKMILTLAATGMLFLAACGTTPTTSPGDSATSASNPATSASPSGSTETEIAAQRYLAIICPPNAAYDAYRKALKAYQKDVKKLNALTKAAGPLAAAKRTQASELKTATWPASVQADIDTLAAGALGYYAYYQSVSQAKSEAAVIAADDSYPSKKDRDKTQLAANQIRLALGLPGANAKNDGC